MADKSFEQVLRSAFDAGVDAGRDGADGNMLDARFKDWRRDLRDSGGDQ